MVGIPSLDLFVRSKKTDPPIWKTRDCCVRSAPAVSTRLITGKRFSSTILLNRKVFLTLYSLYAPPFIVGTLDIMPHSIELNIYK